MTTAPPPDTESARRLIRDLTESTADFARQIEVIEAEGADVIVLSGAFFDLVEDLSTIHRQARQLRNEAFAASVRAAVPNLLPATALQVAREFSAAVVDKHRESS